MSTQDYQTLMQLLIPFFLVISFILVAFILKIKPRPLSSDFYVSGVEGITVELPRNLNEESYRKFKKNLRLPFLMLPLMFVVPIFFVILSKGPDGFSELLSLDPNLIKPIAFVGLLFIVVTGFSILNIRLIRGKYEKSYQLSKNKVLILSINKEEIKIPTIALTEPAFTYAVEHDLNEVRVPLKDIDLFEIYPAMGNAKAQFKITPTGPSAKMGLSLRHLGIGFTRSYFKEHELQILSFMKDQIGDKVVIRDSLKKKL